MTITTPKPMRATWVSGPLWLCVLIACSDSATNAAPDTGHQLPDAHVSPDANATDSQLASDANVNVDSSLTPDASTAPDSSVIGDGGLPSGPCTDAPDGVEITELARSAANGSTLGVIAYRVVYPSADGTRVQGQICVPQAPGPHPIIVYNRGGVAGLGVGEWGPRAGNLCHGTASGGAIFVSPQFRGARDQGNNSLLGPIDFASEGTVEFCAGEVDDALALMQIAQRRCDADPTQVAMWGASHGGCVTLIAASRHPAGLRAAAALVAPIDLVTGYEHNQARIPGGSITPAAGCDAVTDHLYISAGFEQMFGTPQDNPTGYAMRSAIHHAAALATIPLLMIYGAADCLIPVASQGCAMRDALVAQGANVTALHLDSAGQTTTSAVAGCPALTFQAAWPGASGFVDDHYLIIGDGQGHQLEGTARAREFDAIRSFFLMHAPPP